MTWTDEETRNVKRALLGSWPGTIVQWGSAAIDAYLYVLQVRGLEAEDALRAIVTWPAGTDFPPSAPNLAAQALKDPSRPSFDEAWALIRACLRARTEIHKARWESGERAELDERAGMDRARQADTHPLIAPFITRQGGPARLRALGLDDEANEYREPRRKALRAAWEEFCEATEDRDVAALASGARRGEIGRLDPLAALEGARPEIEAGSEA